MISRRAFIGTTLAAAGALSLPLIPEIRGTRAAAATPSTLTIDLVDATGGSSVFAYVTGLAIDSGNKLFVLRSDGKTPYFPASPPGTLAPLGADCAIPMKGGTTITVPHLAAARLWFSVNGKITFLLNPGPALVQPSVSNLNDPNVNLTWDFAEFTYNGTELFANISAVDFVCFPIAHSLTDTSGHTQHVAGLPAGAVDQVAAGLVKQARADGQGWDKLVYSHGGRTLRTLSPSNGMVVDSSLFQDYFEPYVSKVWAKYAATTLTVDTQASFGNVTGRVSGAELTFSGGGGSFAMPTTADIFSCASGPFNSGGVTGAALAVLPRLAAAFNRTTLLADANQPNGAKPTQYYKSSPTNHYARIVHSIEAGSKGYAFPYDDVTPTNGPNQSGALSSPDPKVWTVTAGAAH